MRNKKLLALLLGTITLSITSCSDVIYPNLDNSGLVINDKNGVFTNDDLTYLYEKLHDSTSTPSEIRDLILNQYAINYIGEFIINENNEIKLVGYDDVDDAKKVEFIQKHEIYHDKNTDGTYKDFNGTLTDTIKARVETIKDLIFRNVVTKIFEEANSDSYKTNNYFYEYKYARAKYESSKIGDFSEDLSKEDAKNIYDDKYELELIEGEDGTYSIPEGTEFTNKILIDNSITIEDVDTIISTKNNTGVPVLHLNLYEDYINREIIPDILNTLLIEQYIYDNQYTTLSRTQARKINYVEITYTRETVNSANQLVNTFVENYISDETKANPSATNKDAEYVSTDFDVLADAWKGVYQDKEAEHIKLLEDANLEEVTTHAEAIGSDKENTTFIDGKDHPYYKNTEYGSLIENYAKINGNKDDSNSNEQWSAFTNSGAYDISKGLEIKSNDIIVKDYTKNVWGTSSSGFGDLPTVITDALFDYSVSLDVSIDFDEPNEYTSYVTLVNGRYFLKKKDAQISSNIADQIVIKDTTNSKMYIVEIEHALTQNKMSFNSEESEGAYDPITKEQIAREIGYTLAKSDTYTNTAFQYYLEKCNISYHDQSFYDYMKDTYPDLFEEDK